MIHINNLNAIYIPILTKKIKKTKIYCLSQSSRSYFFKSSKSNEKTINPKWDLELDIDLFRCHILTFLLFSSKEKGKKVYIGRVDINMISFLLEEKGKDLINQPQKTIQYEFQIKTTIPTESFLKISLSYYPVVYPKIELNDIECNYIHIWATFSPPNYDFQNNPIEISMIQGCKYGNTNGCYWGSYSFYSKQTLWENVGYNSQNEYIFTPSGLSQIHSLSFHRINLKMITFILNVSNYQGTVTMNLVLENEKEVKIFNNQQYIVPEIKHKKIGILKTYEIQCEPNHKYCFPFCMFRQKYDHQILFFDFPCLSMKKISSSSEESDDDFNSLIINQIKTKFAYFNNLDFFLHHQINNDEVTLLKFFEDLDLPVNFDLKIYVGGGTVIKCSDVDFEYFWEPFLYIYDKNKNESCKVIDKTLINKKSCSFNAFGYECNFCIELNLNRLDINYVFILIIYSDIQMEETENDGFFLITQQNKESQAFLFANMIYPDKFNVHYAICFRLEYVEDSWVIYPMRSYYKTKRKELNAIDHLILNNWFLPDNNYSIENQKNDVDISEKELSIGEVQ